MSVAWDLAPTPGRMPSRTVRTPLRLVGPGERASEPGLAGAAATAPSIRLNRRGRLLITITVAAAVLTLALLLATSVSATVPQIDHATTVSSGQTLSEVAAAQLPDLPISEAVARIQLANGLNSSQVRAGQSLLIPAMP